MLFFNVSQFKVLKLLNAGNSLTPAFLKTVRHKSASFSQFCQVMII